MSFAIDHYHVVAVGDFGGGGQSYGISPSGGYVVGYSQHPGGARVPFRWTESGGLTDLGTGSGNGGGAYAVNSQGSVVGFTSTGNIHPHPFIYENGTLSEFSVFGGSNGIGYGINDQGEVAGWGITSEGYQHAITYANGVVTDLGTLHNYANSSAYGINHAGHVVGVSDVPGDATGHPFLYSDGTMHDLGTLGGSYGSAQAVNASDLVVGYSYIADNETTHAFSFSNGNLTDIGSLSGDSSALAVNASGLIVGTSTDATGNDQAVFFQGGSVYNLNDYLEAPYDYRMYSAVSVDNSGRILAQGLKRSGPNVLLGSFVLTPVPEPSSFAAVAFGAMTWLVICRRRATARAQTLFTRT